MNRQPPSSTLFPYTTLFRSGRRNPTVVTLFELAGTLGVSHVDLVVPDDEARSEEHTSELQSQSNLVCRLLLEKKKANHEFNFKYALTDLITHCFLVFLCIAG